MPTPPTRSSHPRPGTEPRDLGPSTADRPPAILAAVRSVPRQPPMAPPRPGRVGTMAKLFRGLGDPTRLRVLLVLEAGERSVGELVEELAGPQGRLSKHPGCLRWCGVVRVRR